MNGVATIGYERTKEAGPNSRIQMAMGPNLSFVVVHGLPKVIQRAVALDPLQLETNAAMDWDFDSFGSHWRP